MIRDATTLQAHTEQRTTRFAEPSLADGPDVAAHRDVPGAIEALVREILETQPTMPALSVRPRIPDPWWDPQDDEEQPDEPNDDPRPGG